MTELGSDGGDASGSDAVLVAILSNAIGRGHRKVAGIGDAVVIDATNAFTGRDEEFESLAHQVKSHVNGPVAKAFNCNYAALYDEIDSQRVAPCSLYAAEDGAVEVTEQLIRDAGFHPVSGRRTRERADARGPPRSDDRDQRGRPRPVLLPLREPGEL